MEHKFHIDPGHGWLEVDYASLERLGIAEKISVCSYRIGPTVFLEEDCDAGVYARALKAEGGSIETRIIDWSWSKLSSGRSRKENPWGEEGESIYPIRNFPNYAPDPVYRGRAEAHLLKG